MYRVKNETVGCSTDLTKDDPVLIKGTKIANDFACPGSVKEWTIRKNGT
jgi:hypothetical protein